MTPSARVQAAIDLLDGIIIAARDGGAAADTVIARYFKERRYAGSKDRRAVREWVYRAIRRCGERPETGRAAMLGLALEEPELRTLFDGSAHGPAEIKVGENHAEASLIPAWIIPHLPEFFDENEQKALLERAPLDLRINRLKARPGDVLPLLPDAHAIEGVENALRLPDGGMIEQSSAYRDGLIEVQDVGSQLISMACQVQPGMNVMDLCAGAGGKTLALASGMRSDGRLIAADINRDRLARLPDRAQRAGAEVETLLLNGGRESESLAPFTGQMDVVLVDAPCSGVGTWRRNPEARWRLTPDRLSRLTRDQTHILNFAAPLVKSGGRLVYAVCSLTNDEGRERVAAFLHDNLEWTAIAPEIPLGRKHGDGCLLTPAHDGTDGFFIATLLKA